MTIDSYPTDVSALRLRIEYLERRARRSNRALIAVATLAAAIPLLGLARQQAAAAPADVVQAKSFVVVDADGKTRARFGIEENNSTELRLLDSKGRLRIRAAIHKDQEPIVSVVDEEDKNRVAMVYDGNPHFILSQKGGKPAVHLAVNPMGAGSLLFTHKDGNHNAGIGLHASGDSWLIQRKADGSTGGSDGEKKEQAAAPGDKK
jgi:hypothetical protein